MMYSNYALTQLMSTAFTGASRVLTFPSTYYIGLLTAQPTSSDVVNEIGNITANGYARKQFNPGSTNWQSSSYTVSNKLEIQFNDPSGGHWFYGSGPAASSITHIGIFDASTSGNLWFWLPLGTSKTVSSTDFSPRFQVGALDLTFDS